MARLDRLAQLEDLAVRLAQRVRRGPVEQEREAQLAPEQPERPALQDRLELLERLAA
jgi:hypothetical protein